MATVLFVCLHNAGRSQMSAALFERAARGHHRALSAGSEADRGGHVHPEVVQVMRELGIDLSDRRPQQLTRELAEQADVVVTMGIADRSEGKKRGGDEGQWDRSKLCAALLSYPGKRPEAGVSSGL